MAFTKIDPVEVYNQLNNIDQFISELTQLCDNVNPDISGGWDSDISKKLITPKIEQIKEDIGNMSECITRVRGSVGTYTAGMEEADASGTPSSI